MSNLHPVFASILRTFRAPVPVRRASLLTAHPTPLVCECCGGALTYEPPDPRNADDDGIGVLGCSKCGHGEPAELVREYEAARCEVDND